MIMRHFGKSRNFLSSQGKPNKNSAQALLEAITLQPEFLILQNYGRPIKVKDLRELREIRSTLSQQHKMKWNELGKCTECLCSGRHLRHGLMPPRSQVSDNDMK